MLFGLIVMLLSAAFAVRPVMLCSERQRELVSAKTTWRRGALRGAALLGVAWCLFLGTFVLGGMSPPPRSTAQLSVGAGLWVVALVCAVIGLWLRRGDPEQSDVGSTVFVWGAFAVDPYVRDVLTTSQLLVVAGLFVVAAILARYYSRHRPSAPTTR